MVSGARGDDGPKGVDMMLMSMALSTVTVINAIQPA
jgi:hypothetical protein